jgi:hypothetical protein
LKLFIATPEAMAYSFGGKVLDLIERIEGKE